MLSKTLALGPLMAGITTALQVPDNVRALYNEIQQRGQCNDQLSTGYYNSAFEDGDMSYCADHLYDYGIVYLQGPSKLANMDVDCDGAQGGPQDDGRCDGSSTTIPSTAVRDIIQGYDVGISDLNPHEHSFIVFGNSGDTPGRPTFDPRTVGVQKASLSLVVCGEQMFYAIWGDSNSDDGPRPSVGEASLSLATACYGKGMSGGSENDSSHNEPDVLYITFTGADAVPGANGADWAVGNFDDFHTSLIELGDTLIQRIGGSGGGGGGGGGDDCSWPGHCEGATCSVHQDCAGSLTCIDFVCSCSWPGHCEGATCAVHQDCADALACVDRVCA